jgi:hypothetical protein
MRNKTFKVSIYHTFGNLPQTTTVVKACTAEEMALIIAERINASTKEHPEGVTAVGSIVVQNKVAYLIKVIEANKETPEVTVKV